MKRTQKNLIDAARVHTTITIWKMSLSLNILLIGWILVSKATNLNITEYIIYLSTAFLLYGYALLHKKRKKYQTLIDEVNK